MGTASERHGRWVADTGSPSPATYAPVPAGVDPTVPNVARIYDFFLGGRTNYPADREAARRIVAATAQPPLLARSMRRWLARTVAAMAADGITQFLDLGAGLPTQDNVHDVAARHCADAVVVYVDNDPVVLAHGQPLSAAGRSVLIPGDVRDMPAVLDGPRLLALIDFTRPVGVIVSGVVHFLPATPGTRSAFAALRRRLPPGSLLALNSLTADADPDGAAELMRLYVGATGLGQVRTAEELRAFYGDFVLRPPGFVPLDDWRPDGTTPTGPLPSPLIWGGMAQKPGLDP